MEVPHQLFAAYGYFDRRRDDVPSFFELHSGIDIIFKPILQSRSETINKEFYCNRGAKTLFSWVSFKDSVNCENQCCEPALCF